VDRSKLTYLTQLVIRDEKLIFTVASYASIITIFLNISTVQSLVVGIAASIIYLFINATFIGQAFFQSHNLFIKFLLGTLLLIAILGLVGLAIMLLHNLDNVRTAIALSITALLTSALNRRVGPKNAT